MCVPARVVGRVSLHHCARLPAVPPPGIEVGKVAGGRRAKGHEPGPRRRDGWRGESGVWRRGKEAAVLMRGGRGGVRHLNRHKGTTGYKIIMKQSV